MIRIVAATVVLGLVLAAAPVVSGPAEAGAKFVSVGGGTSQMSPRRSSCRMARASARRVDAPSSSGPGAGAAVAAASSALLGSVYAYVFGKPDAAGAR